MVVVEIRTPAYDEESRAVAWRSRAIARADGDDLQILGDATLLGDDNLTVVDMATGRQLSRSHDPEGWTRNLPHAYRAGDLVAVVVVDTDPPAPGAEPEPRHKLPVIPAPDPAAARTSSARCS